MILLPLLMATVRPQITIIGFAHGYWNYREGDLTAGDRIRPPDANEIEVMGANRQVLTFNGEALNVGPKAVFTLSLKKEVGLGIPADADGQCVGFDKGDPLVSFDGRVLVLTKDGWKNEFNSVKNDGLQLSETLPRWTSYFDVSKGHVSAGGGRDDTYWSYDLGGGNFDKILGIGKDGFVFATETGIQTVTVFRITENRCRPIGKVKRGDFFIASNGKIYLSWKTGITLKVPLDQVKWTKIRRSDHRGPVIKVKGDFTPADIDPARHLIWGIRTIHGHMGEPFIQVDYRSHKEKVIVEGAVGAVGRYDRIAKGFCLY